MEAKNYLVIWVCKEVIEYGPNNDASFDRLAA